MKCKEARKITYISEYPEVISQETVEAKRHLRECHDCKKFFEQERIFSALLKERLKRDEVPHELRQRLLKPMPKQKRYSRLVYKLISLAAVLMLFVGGYIYKLHSDAESMVREIINDHINFLSYSGIQISSSDPIAIQNWFKGRIDFGVVLPELSATLKGARLCLLKEKRLGLVFYEQRDSQLSLFIMTELNPERLWSGKEVIIKGKKVHIVEEKGFNVLLWLERGITYALVSDLNMEELEKII